MPLVGIKMLGGAKDGTLWSGVVALFEEHLWGVAVLVFLSSILFPLLNIILSLLISPVGRNKPVRATARTGVSGKYLQNSPETPPRATRLDGLIPAYAIRYLSIVRYRTVQFLQNKNLIAHNENPFAYFKNQQTNILG